MLSNIFKKTSIGRSATLIFVSGSHQESQKRPSFYEIDRREPNQVDSLLELDRERRRRTPFNEAKEGTFFNAMVKSFDPNREGPPKRISLNWDLFTIDNIKRTIASRKRKYAIFQQRFIEDRHGQLGNEIGAAHFIVFRGGSIKFYNTTKWVKLAKGDDVENYDKNLPKKFVPSVYLECIDLTGVQLYYEGLKNIYNLANLKWLSVRDNQQFDDWCLDKISNEYSHSLEYLDISNCEKVTYHGLTALCKIKNLSKLVVKNISDSYEFQLTCLMLQDVFPNIVIEGVNFLKLNTTDVISNNLDVTNTDHKPVERFKKSATVVN